MTTTNTPIFNHQVVRDLAWVIFSESLINSLPNANHIEIYNDSLTKEEVSFAFLLLKTLDKNPKELEEHLKLYHSKLLGKYFENLLLFWLIKNPSSTLLAHNIQINNYDKTISELDFVYKNEITNKTYHLETAGKFYLYNDEFIGPNPMDHLNKKFDKVINSQLEILNKEVSEKIITDLKIEETIHPKFLLKGYLFHKYELYKKNVFETEEFINPNHPKGWWLYNSDIKELEDSISTRWVILDRNKWLSPVVMPRSKANLNFESLEKLLEDYFEINWYPVLVVKLKQSGDDYYVEDERGFVVSDIWPNLEEIKKMEEAKTSS